MDYHELVKSPETVALEQALKVEKDTKELLNLRARDELLKSDSGRLMINNLNADYNDSVQRLLDSAINLEISNEQVRILAITAKTLQQSINKITYASRSSSVNG